MIALAQTLVEASPLDKVWGIGLSADDPAAHDPAKVRCTMPACLHVPCARWTHRLRWQWRGRNLLGKCLMRVRDVLRAAAH